MDGQSRTTFIVPEMSDAVTFTAIVDDDRLLFNFTYTDNVFEDKGFIERLLNLSQQILAGEDQLSALTLTLPNEVVESESTAVDYAYTSVAAMIEAQVARTPEAVAVSDGKQSLSYQELNIHSNQLAHYLIEEMGVKPGERVAICHSAETPFMVALLACLKAGACYVPVDPNYPAGRIQALLELVDPGLPGIEQGGLRLGGEPRLQQRHARAAVLQAERDRLDPQRLLLLEVEHAVGPRDVDERHDGERREGLGTHAEVDHLLDQVGIVDARLLGERLRGLLGGHRRANRLQLLLGLLGEERVLEGAAPIMERIRRHVDLLRTTTVRAVAVTRCPCVTTAQLPGQPLTSMHATTGSAERAPRPPSRACGGVSMDRDEDRFAGWSEDAWDDLEIPLGDGGGAPPVEPPEPPRGGRPERPQRPPQTEDVVFHPAWTAGVLGLMTAFGALQVVAMQAGARGGYLAVAAIVGVFALLFFLPFVIGAWWFGQMRDRNR